MNELSAFKDKLAQPGQVVITTHRNPDGDAIGSALAVYHWLKSLGHVPQVVIPSGYPDFLAWMPEVDHILVYDNTPEKAIAAVKSADWYVCLDFNAIDRIDKIGEALLQEKRFIALVDHHLEPEDFADFLFSDTSASSTCELVYDLMHRCGQEDRIDRNVAECIFTGILTDTGSFKYGTSPKVYRTVANLLERGVDDYRLQELIFNGLEEKQLRLLGHCLRHRMEILPEYHTGIIVLTKEDYVKYDIQRGDTEGIVNYLLRIKDVKMAAFIMEQPTIVKISLRSKGDFSVQEIASKYFKGGGHRNASGGYSFHGLRAAVRKLKEILPEYQDQLINASI